jgi:hypothetical protein
MIKIFGYVDDVINYIFNIFSYQTRQITSMFDWNDLKIIDLQPDEFDSSLLTGYDISPMETIEQHDTKLDTIRLIKNRLVAEYRKYGDSDCLDWAEIAAHKIYSSHLKDLK